MDLLGSFLEKFRNIGAKEAQFKMRVQQVISQFTQVKIESKDITYRAGTVFLNLSSMDRSEIFLHKAQILECLNEGNTTMRVLDIR